MSRLSSQEDPILGSLLLSSFGHETRFRPEKNPADLTVPGPGGYDSHTVFIKNTNVPRVKFGKSTRDSLRASEWPGPGTYEYGSVYNSTVKKAPAVTDFDLVLHGIEAK